MATVDAAEQKIAYHVAVIGGVSQRFADLLNLTDGKLELAEVKGYKPHLVFHLFSDDPWAGDGSDGARLEEFVPVVDAVVLTDDYATGTHYSSSAVERLAKVLSPMKLRLPTGVFGGPALAEEWQSLSGVAPQHVADPRGGDA
ncbi:MAG TPA: hypothetical protein VF103_00065, partial [Polyangiaceae bacterium]